MTDAAIPKPDPRYWSSTIVHATTDLAGTKTARFDLNGVYRYELGRQSNAEARPTGDAPLVFIMLNPSTADHEVEDPTIRRCLGYARAWSRDTVKILNLFALRSTDPAALYAVNDPVGPENDAVIEAEIEASILEPAQMFICAWGVHGGYRDRDRAVLAMFERHGVTPYCLGTTKDSFPKHPLYLRKDVEPVPYEGRP